MRHCDPKARRPVPELFELRRPRDSRRPSNGLYKAELIHRHGSWRSVEEVETRDLHWWNTQRLHSACDYVQPADFEAAYRAATEAREAA